MYQSIIYKLHYGNIRLSSEGFVGKCSIRRNRIDALLGVLDIVVLYLCEK
jgi:hypothetical protein